MAILSPQVFWFFIVPVLVLSVVTSFRSVPEALISKRGDHGPSRVLLLTAHPDDECMFFAPTLLALAADPQAEVYSLCLSAGDADGMGGVRKREFEQSLEVLGVPQDRRWVLDTPDLQDNFTAEWDVQAIADAVRPYILEHEISAILTFDHEGISSHPNHKSLPKGAAQLVTSLPASAHTPRLFSLITKPLPLKYLSALPSRLAIFTELSKQVFKLVSLTTGLMNAHTLNQDVEYVESALFISGWPEYKTALSAMLQHKSQLVWFRWLYVAFSQYMWANEWVEVVLPRCTTSSPPAQTIP